MSEKSIEVIKDAVLNFAESRKVVLSRIVIFGSQINGNADDESDIDLMLVSKNFNSKTYSQRLTELLGLNRVLVRLTGCPFDLLYYSDDEWEQSSSMMIAEAKLHGIEVYSN